MPGSSRSAASGRDGSIGCHSRHGGSWSRSRASASQQARVLPVEDPPTSTAIPLRPSAAARTTWPSSCIMLARHVGRQDRQPRRRVLGLHRPVHLQGERVGHLGQRPPRHRYAAVRVRDRCLLLAQDRDDAGRNLVGKVGEPVQDLRRRPAGERGTWTTARTYSSQHRSRAAS